MKRSHHKLQKNKHYLFIAFHIHFLGKLLNRLTVQPRSNKESKLPRSLINSYAPSRSHLSKLFVNEQLSPSHQLCAKINYYMFCFRGIHSSDGVLSSAVVEILLSLQQFFYNRVVILNFWYISIYQKVSSVYARGSDGRYLIHIEYFPSNKSLLGNEKF